MFSNGSAFDSEFPENPLEWPRQIKLRESLYAQAFMVCTWSANTSESCTTVRQFFLLIPHEI